MSAFTKTLPFGVRTTVIDHLFREQYNLTFAETIVMCYIILADSWADQIDGFSLLLTSKAYDDLPLGEKTIEAAFTKLKKLGLIETQPAFIHKWSHNKKFRTVRATDIGRKYNLSYHKPKEHQYIFDLEKENEMFRADNEEASINNRELKKENIELSIKIKAVEGFLETKDRITDDALEIIRKDEAYKEEIDSLNKQLEEAKKIIAKNEKEKQKTKSSTTPQTVETPTENDLDKFIKKITRKFALNGGTICNGVEGWLHEVTFHINSFNKITIKLPSGDFKQLSNIDNLRNFWEWLFKNQDRVGTVIKEVLIPDNLIELMEFEGKTFLYQDKHYTVFEIKAFNNGVTILIENLENRGQGFIRKKDDTQIFKIDEAINCLNNYTFI